MHCHDVLGISETASIEEIKSAYALKMQFLASSCKKIPADAYITKQNELDLAQSDCIKWCSQNKSEKLKLRMEEVKKEGKHTTRMYSVCFGPCTFTDFCCGAACDGSSVNPPTCCEQSTGSQTCPIICDAIIWAPGVIYVGYHIIRFLCEIIADAFRNRARVKEERIRARIADLRSQLASTSQKRTQLEQQLGPESDKLSYLEAFTVVFSNMGIQNPSVITAEQETRVKDLRNNILACHDLERTLRSEITSNEQKL